MRKIYFQKRFVFAIVIMFIIGFIMPNISGYMLKPNNISESNCLDNTVEKALTLGNPPEEEWNKSYSIPGWGNCVQETPDDCYIIAGSCGVGYWWDAFLIS